jgi:hypothetical protein
MSQEPLSPQQPSSSIFREILELLTNPKTARKTAEIWNSMPEMPFSIDLDDPDAPWNQPQPSGHLPAADE